MARQLPIQKEKDSTAAFFFLFLYTASVLIRPHEMFQVSIEWIFIKFFAILCLLSIIFGIRPLKFYPQLWMTFTIVPLIVISGFLNASGMDGLSYAQDFVVSSAIPIFLYTTCLTTIKRQHLIMFLCLSAAMVMVHNGHYQQTSPFGEGWALDSHSVGRFNLGERRITFLGFFSDPNDIGMFLVMNIPFVVYFYTKGKFTTKILMLGILASLGYGIYLTGSRGTMVGAGGLIAIYYLFINAGPKLIMILALLAPVMIVAFTALQSTIDESAMQRLEAWYHGIHMLLSNPVFGVGKQQFMEVHGRVAHNSYIHIAGELGIPGYSLWGGALIFTVLTGYFTLKSKITTKDKSEENEELVNELLLNKTLLFSMIAFMITGFFLSRSYTLLLYLFMGMTLASHIRLQKLEPAYSVYSNNQIAIKSMMTCWVIIVIVYLALQVGL